MTDYPAEWLDNTEPPWPDATDPRSGEFLDPWQPTSAERALVDDLALQYVAGTIDFNTMFLRFCSDCYHQRSWPQAFLALLEAFKNTAIGSQGLDPTVKRLAGDLKAARSDALEEAQ